MLLTLHRTKFGPNSTLGNLFVNAPDRQYVFYALEDAVREIPGVPVSEWKIKGRTAIPGGSYDLVITYSNRFKRLMPLLVDVPGFEGVRIHAGNTHEDTEGCVLLGNHYFMGPLPDPRDFIIQESRAAFDAFFPLLSKALEAGPCRIQVVGLPPVQTFNNPELLGEA